MICTKSESVTFFSALNLPVDRALYRERGTLPPTLAAPIWLDESGQPRPTRPCPRCGREAPVYRVRPEHLRLLGWPPFRGWSFVNCCGHAQEVIPALEADGRCRLIPVARGGALTRLLA